MPIWASDLNDVTLTIDGVLETSPHIDEWTDGGKNFITISDSKHFNINGKGIVEGQGYEWWVREWNHQNKHGRPHLLQYSRVQYSEISGVLWRNAPMYHMNL